MALAEPPPVAQSALPADAANFAGRWIALREGQVIADAGTAEELMAAGGVRDDDTLYHVPPPNSAFF